MPIRTSLVGSLLLLAVMSPAVAATSQVCTDRVSEIARQGAVERSLPVDPAVGSVVGEMTEGVHFASDGSFSMAFVETGTGVVLIDAPPSMGPMIGEIAAGLSDRPIPHVIHTHSHADHIGGAAGLTRSVEVIASAGAAAAPGRVDFTDRTDPFGVFVGGGGVVPSPTVIVDDRHVLKRGTRVIPLDARAAGHSPGDMVAYLPAGQVLVAVDITWPASAPWVRPGDAVNGPGLIAQNEALLASAFEHLIAGHLAIVGPPQDVRTTVDCPTDVRAERAGGYDIYPLKDVYVQMVIDAAAAPVLAEWSDRLQGAGTWTCDPAQKMISSLRFDEAVARP